jgi:hypothetical protein
MSWKIKSEKGINSALLFINYALDLIIYYYLIKQELLNKILMSAFFLLLVFKKNSRTSRDEFI